MRTRLRRSSCLLLSAQVLRQLEPNFLLIPVEPNRGAGIGKVLFPQKLVGSGAAASGQRSGPTLPKCVQRGSNTQSRAPEAESCVI